MLLSSFELLEILSTNGFKVQSLKKNPGLSIHVVRHIDAFIDKPSDGQIRAS